MIWLEGTLKILIFHPHRGQGHFPPAQVLAGCPARLWCHTHRSHADPGPAQGCLWSFPAGETEPPSPWNSPISLAAQENLGGVQIPQLPLVPILPAASFVSAGRKNKRSCCEGASVRSPLSGTKPLTELYFLFTSITSTSRGFPYLRERPSETPNSLTAWKGFGKSNSENLHWEWQGNTRSEP